MKDRCSRPGNNRFYLYGGAGIRVCDRWNASFTAFLSDMGPKPTQKHTIDRIDSSKGYEPGNCRWATQKEQSANKRFPTRNPIPRRERAWYKTHRKNYNQKYYAARAIGVFGVNAGKPWASEEIALLFDFEGTDAALGEQLGRSVRSIQAQRGKHKSRLEAA